MGQITQGNPYGLDIDMDAFNQGVKDQGKLSTIGKLTKMLGEGAASPAFPVGAAIQAGGSMVSSYMNMIEQRRQFNEQISLQKTKMRSDRADASFNQSLALEGLDLQQSNSRENEERADIQFNNYLRDDAKDQNKKLAISRAISRGLS